MKINQQRGKVDKLGLVGRDYAKLYHGLQDESEKPHEVIRHGLSSKWYYGPQ
jgi:hypothetical protein